MLPLFPLLVHTFDHTLLDITTWQRLISYSSFVMAKTDLPYDPVGLGVGLVLVIIILICVVVAVVLVVYFYR